MHRNITVITIPTMVSGKGTDELEWLLGGLETNNELISRYDENNTMTILNLAFGTDCLKTSFQMLFSDINLPNMNLGQIQIILVLVGLLSVLATISFTLFLSAKCKDSLTVLLISIVVLFLPIFAYSAFAGASWLSTVLPSAGIGIQNNFLYQLYNFNFLHIGGLSFWTPYVILISSAVELPIFLFLAVRIYCKHQVA